MPLLRSRLLISPATGPGALVAGVLKENNKMNTPNREQLKALWDGSSEYVIFGSVMYRVLTPNGPKEPLFIPQNTSELADSHSTGFPEAPDPPRPAQKRQRPTKITDVGE